MHVFAGGRDLGNLSNRRARSIFKYLILNRGRSTPKDVLMDLLWPDARPRAARNNLNVALHGLRRFLRGTGGPGGHVLFQNDGYQLNPDVGVWLDLTQFERHHAAGRRLGGQGDHLGAARELEAAERLYRGPLFEDDLYEDWTMTARQNAEDRYIDVLAALATYYQQLGHYVACIRVSRKILALQPIYESAHRELMRSYARLDQHHLALRQYRECVRVLRTELHLTPAPETAQLNELIRDRRIV